MIQTKLKNIITCLKQCPHGEVGRKLFWKQCKSFPTFIRTYTSETFSEVWPKLLKPTIFTLGLGTVSFTVCTIIQYERTKSMSTYSIWEKMKIRGGMKKVKVWWDSIGEGHKIAAGIIALNISVCLLWRLPSMTYFMREWFTAFSTNPRSSSLLLSCFSHSEFWHLGANMFVLWSFAPFIQSIMGSEQFVFFYLTGGVVSGLASHCYRIAIGSMAASMGASGALLAVLAACWVTNPDARLSILFLPFFTFTGKTALCSLIALDGCGLIFRWKLFDHAAHLGGTLFGSWYVLQGQKYTWDKRDPLSSKWHEFRKSMEAE